MTLVVTAKNYSSPTLTGDLLITAKTNRSASVLPAIGRDITNFIPPGQARPVDLAQKIYIFGDKVGMVVTGDVGEIIQLLEDFRPFCSANLPTEKIVGFARDYDYSEFRESSYMMLIFDNSNTDEDGMVHVTEVSYGDQFGLQSNSFFREWRLGGSGSADFENLVNEEREYFTSFSDEDPRSNIVKNGALFSRLLAEERYFMKPLESRYGGGYELAFFDGNRLQKMNNIAYMLQTGQYDPDGKVSIQLPVMINHYRYEGDDLLITAVELHDLHMKHESEDVKLMSSMQLRVGCLRVPQLVRGEPLGAHPVEIRSFETCSVGLGFVINAPFENCFKPSCFSGSQAISIKFSAEEKKVEIRMSRGAQEYISSMFLNAYPTFKPKSLHE